MQLYSGLAYSTSAKLIIEFVQCIAFFYSQSYAYGVTCLSLTIEFCLL